MPSTCQTYINPTDLLCINSAMTELYGTLQHGKLLN
jgi:hypothetical protein